MVNLDLIRCSPSKLMGCKPFPRRANGHECANTVHDQYQFTCLSFLLVLLANAHIYFVRLYNLQSMTYTKLLFSTSRNTYLSMIEAVLFIWLR